MDLPIFTVRMPKGDERDVLLQTLSKLDAPPQPAPELEQAVVAEAAAAAEPAAAAAAAAAASAAAADEKPADAATTNATEEPDVTGTAGADAAADASAEAGGNGDGVDKGLDEGGALDSPEKRSAEERLKAATEAREPGGT